MSVSIKAPRRKRRPLQDRARRSVRASFDARRRRAELRELVEFL